METATSEGSTATCLKALSFIRGELAMRRENHTERANQLTCVERNPGFEQYIEAAKSSLRADECNIIIQTLGIYHDFIKEGGQLP